MSFSDALEALQRDHVAGLPLSRHSFQPLLHDLTKAADAAGGRNLNSLIIHTSLASDSLLGDHLIRFFTAYGSLLEASIVFSSISNPTIYTWNFIISAHTSLGKGQRAIELFYEMQHSDIRPDKVIFLCILRTCSMLGLLEQGKHVHKLVREIELGSDLAIGSTLVDMYAKCGDQEQAKVVFELLKHKDVIAWNALMSGYLQHGDAPSCLKLHENFMLGGFQPDRVTFLCLLKAHGLVKSLGKCYSLHGEIVMTGLDLDLSIGTTLQGNSDFAFQMFDRMKADGITQHESSWNALISGFVQQGECLLALSVFEWMQREGVKPDKLWKHGRWGEGGYAQHGLNDSVLQCLADMKQGGVTPGSRSYINALAACSHSGDVSGGWELLRLHDSKELAEECFSQAVRLDSNVASGYVLLANVYANFNKWEDANKLMKLRKYAEAQKKLGTAWIEVDLLFLDLYIYCDGLQNRWICQL
ncbi:hypothetical protein GOP47_0016914 [Adiantum capillus-veneris]|uniref:Pentatricopeptide repeat-containing protein n=1 Tax=Adiantum capillus-veneris TaxID=13818 RepID=A0A9D4UIL0_ADICA|nr:hypothetical protein GOP47_0016914 [Adiantum capillus-veneris]